MPVRLPFQQATRRLFSSSSSGAGVSIPQTLYKNVWRKSTILYITYIVTGCVVIEGIYGGVTNSLWDTYNRGVSRAVFVFFWRLCYDGISALPLPMHSPHLVSPPLPRFALPGTHPSRIRLQKLYKQIDWTKFKSEDDEDEE